jgi:glycosyltransferase involved in cell wall biosynthesis
MPLAFESFDLTGFDLVISVTSEAAKGIRTKPGTLHICYCLTPTRYLWSHYDEYFKGATLKGVAKPLVDYLRKWDKVAGTRPDKIIAISTEVKNRIKKYYDRESSIIFPPVNTMLIRINRVNKGKYYLVVSRLVGYKKVDLVIEVFNKIGYPLVIIGTGRGEKKLKRKARNNIKFVGQVSEKDLTMYYSCTKALIMPQEEDFGIVAVEAQSLGVPVIAYKKGGVADTVVDGKTGILFDQQNVQSLMAAITRFEKTKFVVDNLYTNAKRFSKEIFKTEVLDLVSKSSRI